MLAQAPDPSFALAKKAGWTRKVETNSPPKYAKMMFYTCSIAFSRSYTGVVFFKGMFI